MVQFKDVFTGERDADYARATSTQKCLRVSGKHNDLEEVGRTPRHHTFFEMLGNFSFGDYFKEDAIAFGWELLTDTYGLRESDLWVTVYPGDDEARDIWIKRVGMDPGRVLDDPGNFWSMGDTGPCGPCSEIHIDRGAAFDGSHAVKDPGDRFMELWNLVFMQYIRDREGRQTPLPAPSIDTGMGLERICAVLQGVDSNYGTDLFMPLMEMTATVAETRVGKDADTDTALRVIADHARATAFMICDGIYPENEGRGYVLRRLMRRALRFGHELGIEGTFFTRICLGVSGVMGGYWNELEGAAGVIEKIAGKEEERFLSTLATGMDLLGTAVTKVRSDGGKTLDGDTVFTLYDTHGFPLDLTRVVAEERGLAIDEKGFKERMEEQRERGRASWGKDGDDESVVNAVKRMIEIGKTRGGRGFVGYQTEQVDSVILSMYGDTEPLETASEGDEVFLFTRETPFYGESGGQVGDTGTIEGPSGKAAVIDTRKPRENVVLHVSKVLEGEIRVGDTCSMRVDPVRRKRIRRNHSATHLLHRALRLILGDHVKQRGSLVDAERLRFDFSHTGPVTRDEISAVEDAVVAWVLADYPVTIEETRFDDAVSRGALHFFGDKYGGVVRMVSMGDSIELCGGTHVESTGEIGLIRVVSETGVSSGVRRIEAVTGTGVLSHIRETDGLLDRLTTIMKTDRTALQRRVERLLINEKELARQLKELKLTSASGGAETGSVVTREVKGVKVLSVSGDGMDAGAMRELADRMRDRAGSGYVLISRRDGDRIAVLLAATDDAARTMPANVLLGDVLGGLGGRGGGGPALAQGGLKGVDSERLLDALVGTLKESV